MAPRVLVSQYVFPDVLDALRQAGLEVRARSDDTPMSPDELRAAAADADALVGLLTDRISSELLQACPRLGLVANVAVGFDNVDVEVATAAGVAVSNTPGVLTEATADLAFALILSAARRVPEGDAFLRAGRYTHWKLDQEQIDHDVYGQSLGIHGFGQIGRAVARRAVRGFDMTVTYHDAARLPPESEREMGVRWAKFDELLSTSDFVSVHAPLTPQTHHVIGAEALALMKPTAILVNTARGPIVDEAEARMHLGLVLVDVEARPCDGSGRQRLGEWRGAAGARGAAAAPRQCDDDDAPQDGRDRRGERPGRLPRGAPADAREPAGLREASPATGSSGGGGAVNFVNPLRAAWDRGQVTRGAWCASPSPVTAETLAAVGYDYVCDRRSGGGPDRPSPRERPGRDRQDPRCRRTRRGRSTRWIGGGSGARGRGVPVSPRGRRTYGPVRAAMATGSREPADLEQVVCAVMVETVEGLERLDEIAETEGVDAIYVGPADLALALGLPPAYERDEPLHQEAIESILHACQRHGVVGGIHCADGAMASRRQTQGFRMMTVVNDLALVRTAAASELASAEAGEAGSPATSG